MIHEKPHARVVAAVERLGAKLRREIPSLADPALSWMAGPAPGARPEDRLLHPRFFPIFELPCWAEIAMCGEMDAALQSDLTDSTLNGYLFARLIDDVMDAHDPLAREVLPAAAFFHDEFQRPYQARFGFGHPFWGVFRAAWFGSYEAARQDATLDSVDRRVFEEVSAHKLSAAKIPVAAVLFVHGGSDRLAAWSRFLDCLGRFHQMADDLADFRDDRAAGRATYLLTEAARRKALDESVGEWFVRKGFAWAVNLLDKWLVELAAAARELGSREAELYVGRRESMLRRQVEEVLPALRALAVVAHGMKTTKESS